MFFLVFIAHESRRVRYLTRIIRQTKKLVFVLPNILQEGATSAFG